MVQQDDNHLSFEQDTTPSLLHPLLETERLIQRRFSLEDAPFILELLNDPGWVQFIGDFGVRTLDDARSYIETRPLAMYNSTGFGLYLVALKEGDVPIGMCGLIKRSTLEDVDIGFAFLPAFQGKGYAYEAASAMLTYGNQAFGLKRIVAITTPDNMSSGRLLEKLGLRFERIITFPPENEELKLFAVDF